MCERDVIRLRMSGNRFGNCAFVKPGLEAKTLLSVVGRRIQAGSGDGKYVHCDTGSVTREPPKGHHERCSLHRNIG